MVLLFFHDTLKAKKTEVDSVIDFTIDVSLSLFVLYHGFMSGIVWSVYFPTWLFGGPSPDINKTLQSLFFFIKIINAEVRYLCVFKLMR